MLLDQRFAGLTREELEGRLLKLETAYQDCQRLSVSNDFAAAVMHEVNNPLEAITNLVYLAQDEVTLERRTATLSQPGPGAVARACRSRPLIARPFTGDRMKPASSI